MWLLGTCVVRQALAQDGQIDLAWLELQHTRLRLAEQLHPVQHLCHAPHAVVDRSDRRLLLGGGHATAVVRDAFSGRKNDRQRCTEFMPSQKDETPLQIVGFGLLLQRQPLRVFGLPARTDFPHEPQRGLAFAPLDPDCRQPASVLSEIAMLESA